MVIEIPQANGPMIMPPGSEAGEQSVDELAESMTEKEFRALVILTFRHVRKIHEFVVNTEEALAGMGANGGMMGKMMAGMMPPGLVPPPPPRMQQQHPHTQGRKR